MRNLASRLFWWFVIFIRASDASKNTIIKIGHGPHSINETILTLTCSNFTSKDATVKWVQRNHQMEKVLGSVSAKNNETAHIKLNISGTILTSTYNFTRKAQSLTDAGNYTCEFFNNVNVSFHTETFSVVTAPVAAGSGYTKLKDPDPSLLRRTASYVLKLGDNADIECGATGHPKPNISWARIYGTEEEHELLAANTSIALPTSKHVFSNGSTLCLREVRYEERGFYLCIANNTHDPPLHIFILVRVKSSLAPLLPLGVLVAEVVLLVVIVVVCEWHRRRTSKDEEEERVGSKSTGTGAAGVQNTAPAVVSTKVTSGDARQRPVVSKKVTA